MKKQRPPKLQRKTVTDARVLMDHYSGKFDLSELQDMIEKEKETIPAHALGTINLEVELVEEWHPYESEPSRKAVLNLLFIRPESNAELATRQAESDRVYNAHQARELEEYNRLKTKFDK